MALQAEVNRLAAKRSLNRSVADVIGYTGGATGGSNNCCELPP